MAEQPLSTPLSQLLVAFTIEFDNEFERRLAETGLGRRFGISIVMWSNFLRFVGEEGIAVADLPVVSGLPKPKLLSVVGGMERWRYVYVGPESLARPPTSKRDGFGSARGIRSDWVVRPTEAGLAALEIWPLVLDDAETRWEERFGGGVVGELRLALGALVSQLEVELPEYLPIVGTANGMKADVDRRERDAAVTAPSSHLPVLLSQALLAYTLDFEDESELSLPLSANFVRVLDESPLDVRELPLAAGVSPEATDMALRYLPKSGYVSVAAKRAKLTPKGRKAAADARKLHADLGQRWEARFGAETVQRLRAALKGVHGQRDGDRPRLVLGLEPHPDGWRATKRYIEHTQAVLDDPLGRLPHYPLVLHRGGWPDGS